MGQEKKIIGKIGEGFAREFLKRKGYKILRTNLRTPFGEIDVVARCGDFIVFIEVKTRATASLGPPLLSVTRRKQAHMIKNAFFYLKTHGLVNSNWRIDVVSVRLTDEYRVENIEIIENAVEEN